MAQPAPEIFSQLQSLAVRCVACNTNVSRKDFDMHLLSTKCRVLCPLGCEKKVWRPDWANHLRDCPKAIPRCEGYDVGCLATGTKKEIRDHEFNCPYRSLRPVLLLYRSDMDSLRAEVAANTATAAKVKHGVKTITVELVKANEQIAALKTENANLLKEVEELKKVVPEAEKKMRSEISDMTFNLGKQMGKVDERFAALNGKVEAANKRSETFSKQLDDLRAELRAELSSVASNKQPPSPPRAEPVTPPVSPSNSYRTNKVGKLQRADSTFRFEAAGDLDTEPEMASVVTYTNLDEIFNLSKSEIKEALESEDINRIQSELAEIKDSEFTELFLAARKELAALTPMKPKAEQKPLSFLESEAEEESVEVMLEELKRLKEEFDRLTAQNVEDDESESETLPSTRKYVKERYNVKGMPSLGILEYLVSLPPTTGAPSFDVEEATRVKQMTPRLSVQKDPRLDANARKLMIIKAKASIKGDLRDYVAARRREQVERSMTTTPGQASADPAGGKSDPTNFTSPRSTSQKRALFRNKTTRGLLPGAVNNVAGYTIPEEREKEKDNSDEKDKKDNKKEEKKDEKKEDKKEEKKEEKKDEKKEEKKDEKSPTQTRSTPKSARKNLSVSSKSKSIDMAAVTASSAPILVKAQQVEESSGDNKPTNPQ